MRRGAQKDMAMDDLSSFDPVASARQDLPTLVRWLAWYDRNPSRHLEFPAWTREALEQRIAALRRYLEQSESGAAYPYSRPEVLRLIARLHRSCRERHGRKLQQRLARAFPPSLGSLILARRASALEAAQASARRMA